MLSSLKACTLAASLCLTSSAFAKGVVIEMTHARPGAKPESAKLFLDGQKCRVEAKDHQVIFRGDKGVMWVVEPNKPTFMEITKEDMKKAGEAMGGAMAQMQAQMAAMPPEQRKMMEQMMAGRGMPPPGAQESKREYKANGKKDKVNGFATQGYDALRDGKPDAELWVADWKAVELRQDDFKCFEMIADMMKGMPGADRASTPFSEKLGEGGLPGIPVRTVRTTAQGPTTEELKKIAREDIPGSTFDEPTGKKKETMADMMKGHGPR
ncbi:MAG: DUF4412 domain-containing protein [Deltaproteobacteria bacterium]|nr:DUF4412 domain-containing protein [Deltaproteobacteria bacterium]